MVPLTQRRASGDGVSDNVTRGVWMEFGSPIWLVLLMPRVPVCIQPKHIQLL